VLRKQGGSGLLGGERGGGGGGWGGGGGGGGGGGAQIPTRNRTGRENEHRYGYTCTNDQRGRGGRNRIAWNRGERVVGGKKGGGGEMTSTHSLPEPRCVSGPGRERGGTVLKKEIEEKGGELPTGGGLPPMQELDDAAGCIVQRHANH